MKRYLTGSIAIVAVLMIAGGTVWYTGRSVRHENIVTTAAFPKNDLIKTGIPKRRNFSITCTWFGSVENKQLVKIKALYAGRIVSIKAEDGAIVKQDDPLFIIGGPAVEGRTKTLRQKVASIKKRLVLARGIVEMNQAAVAEKMVKKEALYKAQDALDQLKAELAAAGQELKIFTDARCIRSPVNGVFTNRQVSVGQDVDKGATLADVASQDLRIVAALFPPPGVLLSGKKAEVFSSGGKVITGSIVKTLPRRTPEGATLIWIEGDCITRQMKPGETAIGKIVLELKKDVLAVPVESVISDDREQTFVFLKGSKGYRKQRVQTGISQDGWIEIVSGVSEGDKIVVAGGYELFHRDFAKNYKVAD